MRNADADQHVNYQCSYLLVLFYKHASVSDTRGIHFAVRAILLLRLTFIRVRLRDKQ